MQRELGGLDFMVHSIAFANRDDLRGEFSKTTRDSFLLSLDISAYSLIPLVRHSAALMRDGGSVVAMTFQASERVFPGYNIMGTAKAALENEVRQLSQEFGVADVRVNADLGRAAGDAGLAWHPRLPGHAADSRGQSPSQAQHHPPRGGKDCSVPVQRPVQRHHRYRDTCGRRIPHHGHLAAHNCLPALDKARGAATCR